MIELRRAPLPLFFVGGPVGPLVLAAGGGEGTKGGGGGTEGTFEVLLESTDWAFPAKI